MRGGAKVTVKFTWIIYTTVAIMRPFFAQDLDDFQHTSANVLKFPSSTSEHITSGTREL
jgi:hypothetical protein